MAQARSLAVKAAAVATVWRDEKQKEALDSLAASEAAGRQRDCVVCLEQPRTVVFLPCAHLCVCLACSAQLSSCPICRTHAQKTIRVFV